MASLGRIMSPSGLALLFPRAVRAAAAAGRRIVVERQCALPMKQLADRSSAFVAKVMRILQALAIVKREQRQCSRRCVLVLLVAASMPVWADVAASPPTSLARVLAHRDLDGDGRAEVVFGYGDWWGLYDYEVCHIPDTANAALCATANPNATGAQWGCYMHPGFTHTADFRGTGFHDILAWDWIFGTYIRDVAATLFVPLVNDAEPDCFGRYDQSWRAIRTGDFNGDGRADIVWYQQRTGTTSLWLIGPALGFGGGATLVVHPDWKIGHVADFDGNGRSDLLWRNDATGETAIWLMDGVSLAGGSVVLASAQWRPTLTGDFDGDGRDDIVWRNDASGETAIWLMNGYQMASGAIVVTNPAWTATHVADLDGDGRQDLIWRHAPTGTVNAWLMNGLAMTAGGSVTLPGAAVVATGDYNGDGRADIVWRNPTTYAILVQRMDGLVPVGAPVFVSNDPTAEVLP